MATGSLYFRIPLQSYKNTTERLYFPFRCFHLLSKNALKCSFVSILNVDTILLAKIAYGDWWQ